MNCRPPILLHIDSSPMGEHSVSRRLSAEFVNQWRKAHPEGRVIRRDLSLTLIPPIDAAWIAANLTPAPDRTAQQAALLALSDELTSELLSCSELVAGIPMHNWGPSSSFKLWADQLVRFGQTIPATPNGPQGALGDKRGTFLIAAGQHYDKDPSRNYVEPWLRTLFGYLGLTDIRVHLAPGTIAVRYGQIDLPAFLAPHLHAIHSLIVQPNH